MTGGAEECERRRRRRGELSGDEGNILRKRIIDWMMNYGGLFWLTD